MGTWKKTGFAALLIGIAVVVGLAVWSGIDAVGHSLLSVGWGVFLVFAVRVVSTVVGGSGWWLLFPKDARPKFRVTVGLRFVREATNSLLPLAQVGGEFIGARLLTFYGVPAALAAASVIVDILAQAGSQFVFALMGLATLLVLGADAHIAHVAIVGLAAAAPLLVAFYVAQRRFGHRALRWILARTVDESWGVHGTVDSLYRYLGMIYADRAGVLASGIVHLAGWLIGVAEIVIAFAFMGHPVGWGGALVIESLLHAVRGAAFAVPGALGAQEGALVLLCAIFGIPPDQAIALSLVKRAVDLLLGVPGLIAWQVLEGAEFAARNFRGRQAGAESGAGQSHVTTETNAGGRCALPPSP